MSSTRKRFTRNHPVWLTGDIDEERIDAWLISHQCVCKVWSLTLGQPYNYSLHYHPKMRVAHDLRIIRLSAPARIWPGKPGIIRFDFPDTRQALLFKLTFGGAV